MVCVCGGGGGSDEVCAGGSYAALQLKLKMLGCCFQSRRDHDLLQMHVLEVCTLLVGSATHDSGVTAPFLSPSASIRISSAANRGFFALRRAARNFMSVFVSASAVHRIRSPFFLSCAGARASEWVRE
jgi:hypothetical protein